ncbi:MAG: hypothetical protein AB1630_09245 [bacterium]
MRYLLDTDWVVHYLRGHKRIVERIKVADKVTETLQIKRLFLNCEVRGREMPAMASNNG